jgi:hypothetical protein
MHFAKAFNFWNILDLLIKKNASEKIKNNIGKTPWDGL